MVNRSRSGCLTCRIRRVKCDETLPRCNRCKDTGRRCDGPSKDKFTFVVQHKTKDTPKAKKWGGVGTDLHLSARVCQPTARDAAESRAFSYFLTCVAPSLAGGFDSDFWTFSLPQISENDPAIRHAILAISDLYEHPPEHAWAMRDSEHLHVSETKSFRALQWYNQSLSRFRRHLSKLENSEKAQLALLSCILFTSLEFQQNNVQNALTLLGRGYDIFALAIESVEPRFSLTTSLVDETLMPMFNRHVVLMACFGHPPPRQWTQRFHAMTKFDLGPITSLREARIQLFHHACSGLALIHATGTLVGGKKEGVREKLMLQQTSVVDQIHLWHSNYQDFLKQSWASFDATQRSATWSLLVYFCVVEIWTLTCLNPSPMVFDDHQHRFERIIHYATESLHAVHASTPPPYSFEMGVIPPLYFTGWKCHHPLIRRQALALIKQAPAQEALFSADINYRAARKIIEIEEGPGHLPIDLEHFEACIQAGAKMVLPKEEDRVNGAMVHYENNRGEKEPPSLIYSKGRSGECFAWEQQTSVVPI